MQHSGDGVSVHLSWHVINSSQRDITTLVVRVECVEPTRLHLCVALASHRNAGSLSLQVDLILDVPHLLRRIPHGFVDNAQIHHAHELIVHGFDGDAKLISQCQHVAIVA